MRPKTQEEIPFSHINTTVLVVVFFFFLGGGNKCILRETYTAYNCSSFPTWLTHEEKSHFYHSTYDICGFQYSVDMLTSTRDWH